MPSLYSARLCLGQLCFADGDDIESGDGPAEALELVLACGDGLGLILDLGHLVRDLVDEGKAVAAAAGVVLHDDPWEMNVLATQRGHRHFPSMLEDVEARRPTELESINGALVREAGRFGVAVPLQTAVYRLVRAREASYSE